MAGVFLVLAASLCGAPDADQVQSRCGSYCLYVALKSLDLVDGPYSSFEKSLPPPPADGYSLLDLEREGARFGAKTLAVEADAAALERMADCGVLIALMDRHYVVVKRFDRTRDQVRIIDPPREYDEPVDQFRLAYSNRCLVISSDPISLPATNHAARIGLSLIAGAAVALAFFTFRRTASKSARSRALLIFLTTLSATAPAGCAPSSPEEVNSDSPPSQPPRALEGLTLDPPVHHVGRVFLTSSRQELQLDTRLSNPTDRPIEIKNIQKSCACTSVALASTTIPPHGQVLLKARFKLGITPGPNRVGIGLTTSDDEESVREINYDWDLITPLRADLDHCRVESLEPGPPVSTRLGLWNRGLAFCEQCVLSASGDHRMIEARVEREPMKGEFRDHADSRSADETRVGTLVLTITPDPEPGDFDQSVEVVLQCQGDERAKFRIPVSWSVAPPIQLHPARLWLGVLKPGQKVSQDVRMTSAGGSPFRVPRAAEESGVVDVQPELPTGLSSESSLRFTLSAPSQPGLHRTHLELTFQGEKEVSMKLPISMIVRSE